MLMFDYIVMFFGWVVIRGLINKYWLVFFVGFGIIFIEIFIVLVIFLVIVEGCVFIFFVFIVIVILLDFNVG